LGGYLGRRCWPAGFQENQRKEQLLKKTIGHARWELPGVWRRGGLGQHQELGGQRCPLGGTPNLQNVEVRSLSPVTQKASAQTQKTRKVERKSEQNNAPGGCGHKGRPWELRCWVASSRQPINTPPFGLGVSPCNKGNNENVLRRRNERKVRARKVGWQKIVSENRTTTERRHHVHESHLPRKS